MNKTIWSLVVDLLSYSNPERKILTSIDGGKTSEQMTILVGETVVKGDITIRELIHYLRLNFEDPNLPVKIISNHDTYPIHILGKKRGDCLFIHYPQHGKTEKT